MSNRHFTIIVTYSVFIIYISAHVGQPRSLLTLLPKLARLAATSSSSLVRKLLRLSLLCALQNELHPVCASFVQPFHLHIHTFFVLTPLATLWAVLLDVCPFAMMDYVDILSERLITLLPFCVMVQNGNSFVLT